MQKVTLKEILDSLTSMSSHLTSLGDRLTSVEKKIEDLPLIHQNNRKRRKL